MANPEHLQILQQGVEAWNQWRDRNRDIKPDLVGANLGELAATGPIDKKYDFVLSSFDEINLTDANLTKANFGLASLPRSTFSGATLDGANFGGAILTAANLTRTHLNGTQFFWTALEGADLSEARLYEAAFINTDLTTVRGLETCYHDGPSTLDHRTLWFSGPLPLAFLRGCGLPDWEIEMTKLYKPDLTPTEINDIVYRIYGLRADPLIQFYSCFISYASKDHAFAERLHADLQNKGGALLVCS